MRTKAGRAPLARSMRKIPHCGRILDFLERIVNDKIEKDSEGRTLSDCHRKKDCGLDIQQYSINGIEGCEEMDKKEFSDIRQQLARTQRQMAQVLGVSPKAIQSFEQGWRRIPIHIERQALFLLAMGKPPAKKPKPCWEIRKCSMKTRQNCPAWEFRIKDLCWFINGTICHGQIRENWRKKMTICRRCVVFQDWFPYLRSNSKT